ncbi:MAG: SH3 domain-containing protein [Anaerolineae bacterium]|nr:SH3 domain-containing protein [Anaerolineae bacterium]
MMNQKQIWILPILLILTTVLVGCGVGLAEEKEVALPINLDEWPTSVPTAVAVSPTPFPKFTLDPTATPTPPPAATPTPAPVTTSVVVEDTTTASGDMNEVLMQQVSSLLTKDFAPVAVALTNVDGATIRQGPGTSYPAVSTLERSSLVGVLGQNPAGDWLYVIDVALNYGWLPTEVLRITGSVEGAPVLPPDPVAALIARAISASSGSAETAPAGNSATNLRPLLVADLPPATTARVNNDVLNMRQRPGAEFNLLGTLSRDDEVAVLALNTDKQWALVKTADDKTGWVSVDFLQVEGDLTDVPQVLSLAPVDGHPADQLAPIAAMSGQPIPASTGASSTGSTVTTAAVVNKPTLPGQVLAPVAQGQINRRVELRREPDAASGLLDTMYVDEKVTVLAVNDARDWAVIQANQARAGWLPADNLTLTEGSLDQAYVVQTAWVDSNELEIKSGPGIYHDTVGTLALNDLVAVLAQNDGGNWVLIETQAGGRGWISPKFLTMRGSLAGVPLITSFSIEAPPPAATPEPFTPKWPVQNLLALQLSSGGDIMLINADGSGLRRLTHGLDPVLSPDGRAVAFTRWQGDQGSLWIINTDGSNERLIIDEVRKAKGPTWSLDGAQIMFNYQHGGRLEVAEICHNLSKSEPKPPMNAYDFEVKMKGMTPYLCWLVPPDPHWGLRLVNLADGRSEDVFGGTYAFRPAWDPGQPWRIVSDSGMGLLGIDLNRPDYREPLTDNVNDGSPVFSPDGCYLAVTVGNQGGSSGYDIFRLNADGSGRVRLTQTPLWVPVGPDEQKPWNNVASAWSPDGSQIAFLTDRAGRWEIWVMNADGSNQRQMFSNEVNDQLDLTYNFVDEQVLSWR